MKKNKDIEEAVVTVHEMSEDEKLRRLAELREKAIMDEKAIRKAGYVHGMEEGIEKGIETGKVLGEKSGIEKGKVLGEKNEKIKIAKKLKEMEMSMEEIKEITGLSEEEIKKSNL